MKCFIDEKQIQECTLLEGEMGSQEKSARHVHDLRVTFARTEFIHLLANDYRSLVRELAADIEKTGGADDDERACLQHAELAHLMASAPQALFGVVREYLWKDILRLCFGRNTEAQAEYVVGRLHDVFLADEAVTIYASAFRYLVK